MATKRRLVAEAAPSVDSAGRPLKHRKTDPVVCQQIVKLYLADQLEPAAIAKTFNAQQSTMRISKHLAQDVVASFREHGDPTAIVAGLREPGETYTHAHRKWIKHTWKRNPRKYADEMCTLFFDRFNKAIKPKTMSLFAHEAGLSRKKREKVARQRDELTRATYTRMMFEMDTRALCFLDEVHCANRDNDRLWAWSSVNTG